MNPTFHSLVVPMVGGLLDAATTAINEVKIVVVALAGLIALLFVVIAVVRAGLAIGVIVKAGLGAALIIALCGGLLFHLAAAGQKDISNRLNGIGGAISLHTTITTPNR